MNGNDLFLLINECILRKSRELQLQGMSLDYDYNKVSLFFDDFYYKEQRFECEVSVEKVEVGLTSIKFILQISYIDKSERIDGVNFTSLSKILKILKGSKKKIEIILDEDSYFYINKIYKLEVRESVCVTLMGSDLIFK